MLAWAGGGTEPHPGDPEALAACRASGDPLLRAAAHTYAASGHLAEFRFGDALDACVAAESLLADTAFEQPADERAFVDPALVRSWTAHTHADALDELGRFDEAAERARAAAELADAHRLERPWARAVSKQIWIARQQGDAGHAATLLRQLAGRLAPSSHLLCAALGSTLAWLGRPETALAYSLRCLTLPGGQGRRARDHRDLAGVYMRLDRLTEARQHLDRAAAELALMPTTCAGRFMLVYAEYHFALASGDFGGAAAIAGRAAGEVSDSGNLRRHLALLAVARAQRDGGDLAAMAATLARVDVGRLGAEHRALALRLDADAAQASGDLGRAAAALGEARRILASRYLAIPTVLLIEAELAVADPFAPEWGPGSTRGRVFEFNRAVASRDQLLMAAAKDLRGPIAVFELGAELLADPDVDGARVAQLIERGLTEMQLLVEQLRDFEAGPAADDRPAASEPLESLDALVDVAITRVDPIASSRQVTVAIVDDSQSPANVAPEVVTSALTSVLALAVRAAEPETTVTVGRVGGTPRVIIELAAAGTAPIGWAAVDSITSPTAGGPTTWQFAAAQLAGIGGGLSAAWAPSGRLRVTVDAAGPG